MSEVVNTNFELLAKMAAGYLSFLEKEEASMRESLEDKLASLQSLQKEIVECRVVIAESQEVSENKIVVDGGSVNAGDIPTS